MPDVRPSPRSAALKVVARVKARGISESIDLAAGRLREAISSQERLMVLVRGCHREEIDAQGFVARWATEDDADAYGRQIGTDAARTFRERLAQDTRCFIVTNGDLILHATWCTTSAAWTRELHAYLAPPAGDAYVYESFTRPEARGKGVYPLALRSLASDLAGDGINKVWVAVEEHNVASLRSVTKAGFQTAFSILFGRRWGRVWVTREVGADAGLDATEPLQITANPAASGPSGG